MDAYGQTSGGFHQIHTSNITIKDSNLVESESKNSKNVIDEKMSEEDTIWIKEMFGNCSAINL